KRVRGGSFLPPCRSFPFSGARPGVIIRPCRSSNLCGAFGAGRARYLSCLRPESVREGGVLDMNRWTCRVMLAGAVLLAGSASMPRPDPLEPQFEKMVEKALQWLVKQQHADGHWEAPGGQFVSAMTAMAGICLLEEGSTMREGRFRKEIKKTVEWC